MADPRLEKLAKVLVHYCTRVKPGEFVVVDANEVAIEWIIAVAGEAIRAGARVETAVDLDAVREELLRNGTEAQLTSERLLRKYIVEHADVWLTAWGTLNTKSWSNLDPGRIRLAQEGAASWRRIYSDRMADGTLRWCGTQYPTHADAQEAEMSLREYEDFVYGAGLIDTDDPVAAWERIEREQDRWVKYLDGKKELRIEAEGTDLRVKIAGRKWINCCGRHNFPDGEVFTSPIEDGVDGRITFSFPGIYAGKAVEGIYLEVKAGRVVEAAAKKGQDLLLSLLDTDANARRFGEVAVGTNYNIRKFTRNMLFDEKIGGTVHLALGESMGEAGGKNPSAIHWDMLCDMRQGGRITADGEVCYENGKFVI